MDRRAFVKKAGMVTGAAAIGAAPQIASAAGEPKPELTDPTTTVPREPLAAYVRDAERGEVTVVSGTSETTYRDPALVKRLLKAASKGAM
jgi:hypothetical protein